MSDYNNDSRSPKKVVRSPEYIRIKVVEEEYNNEMYFSLAMSTEMWKLKKSYAKREDVRVSSLRFFFEGKHIDDEHTPKDLGMTEDDIIEVYQAGRPVVGPRPENRNSEFSETKVAGHKKPSPPLATTPVTKRVASNSLEEGEIAIDPKSKNCDNIISSSTTTNEKIMYKDTPSSPVKMDFDEKKQNVDGENSKEKPRSSHKSSGSSSEMSSSSFAKISSKRKYKETHLGKWFRINKNRDSFTAPSYAHKGGLKIKDVKKDELVIIRECVAKSCHDSDLIFVQSQIGYKAHILKEDIDWANPLIFKCPFCKPSTTESSSTSSSRNNGLYESEHDFIRHMSINHMGPLIKPHVGRDRCPYAAKCHYFNSKSKEDVIEHFLDIKGPHGYTNFNYILVSLCVVKQQQQKQQIESHPAPSKQPKLENINKRGENNKNIIEHHPEDPRLDNNINNVEAVNNHDSNSISGVEAADADEEPDPDQKILQEQQPNPKVVKVKGSDALTNLMQEYDETDKIQEQQIKKFKGEIEELKSKVQKGQDQIKFLNEDNDEFRNQVKKLKDQVATYKEENDDFRSYVRKLEHKSEKYEQMQYYVNGHEADKSKLISKMEDMKVKFEKQWNNLQSKNEDLQHLLDAMKHDMKDQANENQEVVEKLDNLKEELTKTSEEKDSMEAKFLNSFTELNSKNESERQKLHLEKSKIENTVSELRVELSQRAKERNQFKEKIAKLSQKGAFYESKITELDKKCHHLTEKCKELDKNCHHFTEKCNKLQSQLSTKDEQIETSFNECVKFKTQISQLEGELTTKSEEIQKKSKNCVKFQTQISQLEEKSKELEDTIQTYDVEKDQLKQSKQELENKILNMENQKNWSNSTTTSSAPSTPLVNIQPNFDIAAGIQASSDTIPTTNPLCPTNNVKIKHENNDESTTTTTDFFKLKDEVSLKIDENLDIKTENVKLRHQNESLITEMAIMKSALEKKSRILALRNAEIALLDPDRCIME